MILQQSRSSTAKITFLILFVWIAVPGVPTLQAQDIITTVAGDGYGDFSGDDGPATSARLNLPFAVAMDGAGNLFIADSGNHRIRRVDGVTGIITTVAGKGVDGYSGDGDPATSASLKDPHGVAVDGAGNLFIADSGNHRIRRVDAVTGIIATVAGNGASGFDGDGGWATYTSLNIPVGVAVDSAGNLFIADQGNGRIRRVVCDVKVCIITTVAGIGIVGNGGGDGGLAVEAFLIPFGVTLDGDGNLFIAERFYGRIRRVDAVTGVITTVAGSGYSGDGGPATGASLQLPSGVAVDASGNLFIADTDNHRIRRVDAVTGIITTVAGNGVAGYCCDGVAATSANLRYPRGVAVDAAGNLFIADQLSHRIRKVAPAP